MLPCLIGYISAGSEPDHFLTKERIAELSQKVIEKRITYESALHMASLAYDQKDFEKQAYWEAKASDSNEKGVHTPTITPNVLKDTFNKERGYRHEE